MTTALARGAGDSGALMTMEGTWSNGLPLREMIAIYEGGSPMDLTGIEFELQLRETPDGEGAALTVTTDDGFTIESITNDDDDEIEVLQFDDVDLTALEGDYYADFIMKDADGNATHLARGIISVRDEPVTISI